MLKDLIRQHALLSTKSQSNISSYFVSSTLTSHRRNRVQTEREATSVVNNADTKGTVFIQHTLLGKGV